MELRLGKMVKKKKICEIKIYEYYTMEVPFYRAECNGISAPGSTIRKAIRQLLESDGFFWELIQK